MSKYNIIMLHIKVFLCDFGDDDDDVFAVDDGDDDCGDGGSDFSGNLIMLAHMSTVLGKIMAPGSVVTLPGSENTFIQYISNYSGNLFC